ncbi:MAG: hypothetical protein KAR45_22685 [Desulfobacteraceae bacterium]|nr:hypothetical protein [Desulfobacteraceae bacterium]
MPIVVLESQYPLNKNKEVLAAWLGAIEKYPRPEDIFTTLVDTAVSSDKNGLKVLSAYLINPGKYEEASAYLRKFMTAFFGIEGYVYEFTNWSTIEEAMQSIDENMPER